MIEAPPKARSEAEILVEKFNQWADDRILERSLSAYNPSFDRMSARARIDELEWAKTNLKRLAEEIVKNE